MVANQGTHFLTSFSRMPRQRRLLSIGFAAAGTATTGWAEGEVSDILSLTPTLLPLNEELKPHVLEKLSSWSFKLSHMGTCVPNGL